MWNQGTITETGKAILAQAAAGNKLNIDWAQSGTQTVAEDALKNRTAVAGTAHTVSITAYTANASGVKLTVQFTAASTAYVAKQIGIFGHTGDNAPGLIAIYQDEDGIAIPATADMPDFLAHFYATIQISNIGDISVRMDPDAFISREQFEAMVEQELPTQVASWLGDHVSPSTGYVVDDSLSIEGAAADAKAVGKARKYYEECARQNLVPYGTFSELSASLVTGSQYGNEVTLNGELLFTGTSGYSKLSISEILYLWNGTTTPDIVKNYTIPFIKNHTYKIRLSKVSGTYSPDTAGATTGGLGIIKACVMNSDEGDPVAECVMTHPATSAETIYVSDGLDARIQLMLSWYASFTDLVLRITLEDITETISAGDITDLKSVLNDAMSTDIISVPYKVSDEGKGIRFSTGALYTLSVLNATDFIDISAYDYLTYTRIKAMASSPVYGMAFYDVNKEYVSGIRATINNASMGYALRDLQIPDGAVYARFSILADAETYGNFSLYGKSKLQKTVDDTIQNCEVLAFNELVSVPYHIMFYGGFVKFADGTTTSSSNVYAYTEYVDVSRYSRIKYKSIADTISAPTHGMAFYDADKNFISGRRSVANSGSLQYVEVLTDVPKAAKYARFTVFIDSDTYGDFALWGTSKLYDLADVKSPYEKNVLIAQVSPEWYEAQGESYEGFTINTLYAEIIAAWDVLLANSKGYITKDEIGTASDGQTMYCYKLIPARYRHSIGTSITNNAPVFLIVPSIHGYEKSAAYGTYYFARDLVYNFNKNPVLNSLRTKCIIYVVPVGNPWGFDNKQRKNANGVDCNRNWGPDPSGTDDPTSPYYPGAEPFDQPEVQAIKSVIDNAENLFFVVDYHTDGQYKAASWSEVNWITWGASIMDEAYSARAYLASQFQLSDVSENLPLEYDFDTNGDAIGSITLGAASAPRPTISYYTRTELNILGGTFEGNNGLPISTDTAYSPMEQKINSELIGNWIKNLMLIYKNIDK